MPRFFFNVIDGKVLRDEVGTELPDLQAVREEAVRASGEMLQSMNGHSDFWSGQDWTMNVLDEAGAPVVTLRFSGTQHR